MAVYVLAALVFAGYAGVYFWVGWQNQQPSNVSILRAVMYLAIPALAAFTAFVAWIFADRAYKRTMFFFAVATVLMVSGEAIWTAQSLAKASAVAARTGLGDYLISGGYLFLWALLLSMARFKGLRTQTSLRRLVDVYLYLLFTALFVWNVNFRYVFLKISSFTNLGSLIVAVAPVLILALVFGVAANTVGFKQGRWRPWDILIALGVSSSIAASVGFTYLSVRGAYTPTDPVTALPDIGWMAGYFMFFLAGASYLAAADKSLHKVDEVREPRLLSWSRELLIYVSILGSILLFIPLALMNNPAAYDVWVVLVCSAMLLMLVILRAFLYVSATNKLVLTSLMDMLTSVNNYRYLQTKLDAELSRAMRYDETLSIVLIDLYKFSEVNKTRGHAMGDAILKSFAKVLRTYLRLPDSVCRIAGDEFAIILPQTGLDGAERVCERIKETLKDKNHSAVSVFLNGVSCGISSYPDHGEDRQTLLDKAETALKWAESHGRDQVAVYDERKMAQGADRKDVEGTEASS